MRLAALLLCLFSPVWAWAEGQQTTPKAERGSAFGISGSGAFDRPVADMPRDKGLDFTVGRALFERLWVIAPASTQSTDGLGPLYNARSCAACHPRAGRASPDSGRPGLLLRLSAGRDAATGAPLPDPTYGLQLQDRAIAGMPAEGQLELHYEERIETLPDGTEISLRAPSYSINTPRYGPFSATLMSGPRIAPPMIGMGLLAAIPDAEILSYADPEDADGDGISGRPNQIYVDGEWVLGRFGWKANEPDLPTQIAAAFSGDLGLGTHIFPAPWGDCTPAQSACRAAPDGNSGTDEGVEIPHKVMDFITFYVSHLGVPPRRNRDAPEVRRGEEIFAQIGCASCHRPSIRTRMDAPPALANRLIAPYSDLLLHDMGEGLADHRPDWAATGREWRTAPLWGIGLTKSVTGHESYLHDGRARSLMEAILWHGGEAYPARSRAARLPTADRQALLAFLESL